MQYLKKMLTSLSKGFLQNFFSIFELSVQIFSFKLSDKEGEYSPGKI